MIEINEETADVWPGADGGVESLDRPPTGEESEREMAARLIAAKACTEAAGSEVDEERLVRLIGGMGKPLLKGEVVMIERTDNRPIWRRSYRVDAAEIWYVHFLRRESLPNVDGRMEEATGKTRDQWIHERSEANLRAGVMPLAAMDEHMRDSNWMARQEHALVDTPRIPKAYAARLLEYHLVRDGEAGPETRKLIFDSGLDERSEIWSDRKKSAITVEDEMQYRATITRKDAMLVQRLRKEWAEHRAARAIATGPGKAPSRGLSL